VRVHSLTLSFTPGLLLLAHNLASPCFHREPKARVATTILMKKNLWDIFNLIVTHQNEGAKSSENSNAGVVDRQGNGQIIAIVTMTSMHK